MRDASHYKGYKKHKGRFEECEKAWSALRCSSCKKRMDAGTHPWWDTEKHVYVCEDCAKKEGEVAK